MEFKRTANAGGLLTLDGITILIDGICDELSPYMGTPSEIKDELLNNIPDAVLYTHKHKDHYNSNYITKYIKDNSGPVFGPELALSGKVGNLEIIGISNSHIGKCDIPHSSYMICGSKNILITGDASPLGWKKETALPVPDVIIVAYAYCITKPAWEITKKLGAEKIILLHLPYPEKDEYGLWEAVKTITDNKVEIPSIGEIIEL